MSGRRRSGLSPNLFPFLAVLICTLGTLILLLALVAQNAGKAAAASAENQTQDQAETERRAKELAEAYAELDQRVREAKWQRDEIVKMRQSQTSELDERRTKQTYLEDQIRQIADRLKQLETEMRLAKDRNAIVQDTLIDLDSLKAKIDQERLKVQELKDLKSNPNPKIVIVPHKGPNGTDRRAIYVECGRDAIYIQPGDIAIDLKYLSNDIPGPNPLDSALRTIRNYSMKQYGDVDAPYPLIVIRPDGIEAYAAARYAMRGWDDQYGYELVPAEVKLSYPNSDPELDRQVEKSIAQAVKQQEAYLAGLGSGSRGAGRGGYGSGQDPVGNDSLGNDNLGNDTSRRMGTGPGSSPAGDFSGATDGNRSVASGTSGGGLAGNSGPAAGELAGNDTSMPGGPSSQPAGRTPRSSVPAKDLPVLSARDLDAYSQANGFGGRPNTYAFANDVSREAAQQTAAEVAAARAAASHASQFKSGTGGPSGDSAAASGDSPASADAMKSGNTGSNANMQSSSQAATASQSKSSAMGATSDPNAPIGGTQATGSAGNQDSSSDQIASNQTRPDGQAMNQVNAQVNPGTQQSGSERKRVSRQGKDWALPRDVAATTGTAMVRMIRVECYEDRLVMLPERGKGQLSVYGIGDAGVDQAAIELATDVRDRVAGWGAAMRNARWSPVMEVDVKPGGEQRFEQLRRSMQNSGVEVVAKGATP